MTIEIGVVMDPIDSIHVHKDSTLAMLLAAQRRGWTLQYMETPDLFLREGQPWARMRALKVRDDPGDWYSFEDQPGERRLDGLTVILMRKDPPVDMEYLYATHILERAEAGGALVVNRPGSLRDVNEKLYTAWFPQCCAPTLVTSDPSRLRRFLDEQGDIIVKPLDAMGGASIFRIRQGESNTSVILETMTARGTRQTMAQRFVPEIAAGDKRILMIDGEPVPYALARIPAPGESRGNLAAGGRGEGVELTERDRWICSQVAPSLKAKGLLFAGLDVIGEYLTEINVTSPTCIRELDRLYGLDIAGQLMDRIERQLTDG
ncbi:MAG: glutathione synthase [Gammaproteobacteria bacterium]